jgi:hypothetical protein
MPYSTICNKVHDLNTNEIVDGCKKQMEPYLESFKNDNIFCSLCNRQLANVSHFVKIQMKTLKQVRPKITTSFAIKCKKCGKEDRPILAGSDILCSGCKRPHEHLSEPFKIMLRDKLKTAGHDI